MTTSTPRRPLHPLRWWWVLLGVVFVAASIWASTTWLLAVAGPDRGLRIEAIKTGLTVGAGTGGGVALLLAVRRQWLNERAQAHQEDVAAVTQAHQEQVAAVTEHDATERRVTDLYTKAVDQLGSEQAAVRLGGLYALERLAQDHPAYRQTIVNVICAYLRMPFVLPAEDSAPGDSDVGHGRREELQVRQTAQRILSAHLRDVPAGRQGASTAVQETFWPGIHLDLTGAHLVGFGLPESHLGVVQCNQATFTGGSVFRGLKCELALFQGATFNGHTDFRGADFTNDEWFASSTFASEVWFHADRFYSGARFGGHASFKRVTFAKGARFNQATFSRRVEFDGASYGTGAGAIELEGAQVQDPTAVSPEVTGAPISWPPGWEVELGPDGVGSLTWRAPSAQNPASD